MIIVEACGICGGFPLPGEEMKPSKHGMLCPGCRCWYCEGTSRDPDTPLLDEPCAMCKGTGLGTRARLAQKGGR